MNCRSCLDGDPEGVVERLVSTANDRGGHDNITCIVAVWEGADFSEDEATSEAGEVELVETERPPEPEGAASEEIPPAPEQRQPPPDVQALARDLLPWWIAAAALMLCAVVAGIVAVLGG